MKANAKKAKSIVIPVDWRRHHWGHKNGSGEFSPSGDLLIVNDDNRFHKNGQLWSADETHSARLFVGFNVQAKPVWDLDDLISLVERVRVGQGEKADSTFLAQKGIYTSRKTRKIVHEDGAQVILIDTDHVGLAIFEPEMVELAEVICREFHQEEVVLEIQRNGISIKTIGIDAS